MNKKKLIGLTHSVMPWVWLDGRVIPKEEARIPCFCEGVIFGQGLFETLRVYGGKIFALDRHIRRLSRSAPMLDIAAPPFEVFKKATAAVITKNKINNAALRLNVAKDAEGASRGVASDAPKGVAAGAHVFVFARPLVLPSRQKYEKGGSVFLATDEYSGKTPFEGLKTFNHFFYQHLSDLAKSKGYDEAVFTNSDGALVEGSRTNIFVVKNRALATPALSSGCLGGITREIIKEIAAAEKSKFLECPLVPEDLFSADEVFVTNSLMEVLPIARVNNRRIGGGAPGELTRRLAAAYRRRVEKECGLG